MGRVEPTLLARLEKLERARSAATLGIPELPSPGDFGGFERVIRQVTRSSGSAWTRVAVCGVAPEMLARVVRRDSAIRADALRRVSRNGRSWLAANGFAILRVPYSVAAARWLADSLDAEVFDGETRLGAPHPVPRAADAAAWDWAARVIGDDALLRRDDLGRGVRVAVLDTGVAANHAALRGRLAEERDFTGEGTGDGNGHGTHCASIALGRRVRLPDGSEFRGIAPGAQLYSGKCLDARGGGTVAAILQVVGWAIEVGADVISMSLGAPLRPDGTSILTRAVNVAAKSVVVVVPAGNAGPRASSIPSPGDARGAITTAAHDHDDQIARFSGRGPSLVHGSRKPDVAAPGVNIYAAGLPRGSDDRPLVFMSGTSMATPMVAGLVAALLAENPWLRADPATAKSIVLGACREVGRDADAWGAGAACLAMALEAARQQRSGQGAARRWSRAAPTVAFGVACALAGASALTVLKSGSSDVSIREIDPGGPTAVQSFEDRSWKRWIEPAPNPSESPQATPPPEHDPASSSRRDDDSDPQRVQPLRHDDRSWERWLENPSAPPGYRVPAAPGS